MRGEDFLSEIAGKDWFHGTDSGSADSVARSQRADFRRSQSYGPGLYVTPNEESAASYARGAALVSRQDPVVQAGVPEVSKAISLTHRQLDNIGRQFRRKHPTSSEEVTNTSLGNISLRTKKYDFLHINEDEHGDPVDVGVILRPKKWLALEDREVDRG